MKNSIDDATMDEWTEASRKVMTKQIDIEQEIQAKGLTTPRVTPQQIEDTIVGEYFFTAANGVVDSPYHDDDTNIHNVLWRLTFCVLVLRNGFTVTGESACVSPENFDAEIGRKIARQNAVQKIWSLEGYLLAQRRHQDEMTIQVMQVMGDLARCTHTVVLNAEEI